MQERIHECIAVALTGMHSPVYSLPACLLPPSSCSFATRKTHNKCTAVRCLKIVEIYRNATHCVLRWRKLQSILRGGKMSGETLDTDEQATCQLHLIRQKLLAALDPDKSCWLHSISPKLPATSDLDKSCQLHSILRKPFCFTPFLPFHHITRTNAFEVALRLFAT